LFLVKGKNVFDEKGLKRSRRKKWKINLNVQIRMDRLLFISAKSFFVGTKEYLEVNFFTESLFTPAPYQTFL